MDLLDFEGQDLYFDEPLAGEVEQMIRQAAESYGSKESEQSLLKAIFHAPDHLTVHVALYRFYFYQHRYHDAIKIAERTLDVTGKRLEFPAQWRELNKIDLGAGALKSMGLLRYYLLALKALGYLKLRVGQAEEGMAILNKVSELDTSDRLGVKGLMEVVATYMEKNPANVRMASHPS